MKVKAVIGPDAVARRALVRKKADLVLDWRERARITKPFRKVGIINVTLDDELFSFLFSDQAEEVWLEFDLVDDPKLVLLLLIVDEVEKVSGRCYICGKVGVVKLPEKEVVVCRACLSKLGLGRLDLLSQQLPFLTGSFAEEGGS